jgi:hypothetical protein
MQYEFGCVVAVPENDICIVPILDIILQVTLSGRVCLCTSRRVSELFQQVSLKWSVCLHRHKTFCELWREGVSLVWGISTSLLRVKEEIYCSSCLFWNMGAGTISRREWRGKQENLLTDVRLNRLRMFLHIAANLRACVLKHNWHQKPCSISFGVFRSLFSLLPLFWKEADDITLLPVCPRLTLLGNGSWKRSPRQRIHMKH